MKKIRSKDTKPEKIVRSLLHRLGYRFRLHKKDLPGTPDIVLPKHKCAIFVNGCFWHQHPGCKYAYKPKTRTDYWFPKLKRNVERDSENHKTITKKGWRVIVIWECEIRDQKKLNRKISMISN